MKRPEEVQTILKKSKLQNIKDMVKIFLAEDPLLTFIITGIVTVFYPTLLTLLVQALFQNDRTTIYLILGALAGINIVSILPLLVLRARNLNKSLKTNAEIKLLDRLGVLKERHEEEKHQQVHRFSDAKIENLQAQTRFIFSMSSDSLVKIMQHNAGNLQENFSQENIRETMEGLLNILGEVITRFGGVEKQYEEAAIQITEICDKLGIEMKDLTVEPLIDPKKTVNDLEQKYSEILKDIPDPAPPLGLEDSEEDSNDSYEDDDIPFDDDEA